MQTTFATLEESLEALFKDDQQTNLIAATRYALFSGGKRLRPKLLFATVEALDGCLEKTIIPAISLECIHTYSLIHDDLPCMDDDDFRRGHPTVHKQFGEATALLAGDLLLTHAFELLSTAPNLSDRIRIRLIQSLCQKGGLQGMIGGQFLDIEAEGKSISRSQLQNIHNKKTGALIASAIQMGAIIAEASPEVEEKLIEIGYDLGLAFQIMDDVLDVTSSVEKHGKEISSDIERGKTTYVSLLSVDGAKEEAMRLLERCKGSLEGLNLPNDALNRLAEKLVLRTK